MSIKCTNCQKGITTLKFSDASVITSGKYRVPAVLITLVALTAASITTPKFRPWSSSPARQKNERHEII